MIQSMGILIGYESALEYWRLVGPGFVCGHQARKTATRRARKVLDRAEKPQLSTGNRRPAGCTLPLQVLVGSPDVRTKTGCVVSHTWTSLPDGSLVDAGQGFFVSTPEFCFLQMASTMTLAQLIQLGMELCGTYALVSGRPAVSRDAPLTMIAKLKAFVEAAANTRGRAKALRALRYLLPGSASPMETTLALLLCLPYSLGGYGLEKPLLNYRIDVPSHMRDLADRSYCLCDACWPDAKLAVEYDSKLHHTEPDRQSSDARRRSTLATLGFTVITVMPGHLADSATFNRLARQIAKLTGKRLRYRDPDFTHAHLELRAQLFKGLE